jgi:cytosine/adenosine deaminase-related metal-dependent hydrolase
VIINQFFTNGKLTPVSASAASKDNLMGSLFVHNITHLIPDFSESPPIPDGALYIQDNVIKSIGTTNDLLAEYSNAMFADTILDGTGLIIIPGLVNTHHHLYQTLTRAVPTAQNVSLFNWLKTLYPIWAKMDAEAVYVSCLCQCNHRIGGIDSFGLHNSL